MKLDPSELDGYAAELAGVSQVLTSAISQGGNQADALGLARSAVDRINERLSELASRIAKP